MIRTVSTQIWSEFRAQPQRFWIAQLVFLFSGFSNNILASQIDSVRELATTKIAHARAREERKRTNLPTNEQMGAGNPKNGLIVLVLYAGQLLSCLCFPSEWKTFDIRLLRRMWYMCVLDLVAAVCYYTSLNFIGSGMATVLYSGIIVWTALLKRILYGTKMSIGRWVSVFCVPVFVSISAVEQVNANKSSTFDQIVGCSLIIVSSFFYAILFCLNNNILDAKAQTDCDEDASVSSDLSVGSQATPRDYATSPTATHVAAMYTMNCVPISLYIMIYAMPRWDDFMFDEDNNGGFKYGSTPWTLVFYACLLVSFGLHQQSVYHCLGSGPSAAVTAGVSKALQAAGTFVLSSLFFCKSQHAQCLDRWKTIGMAGIVYFVLWYSICDVISKSVCPGRRMDDGRFSPLLEDEDVVDYERMVSERSSPLHKNEGVVESC